jgi:hypothetical protein
MTITVAHRDMSRRISLPNQYALADAGNSL